MAQKGFVFKQSLEETWELRGCSEKGEGLNHGVDWAKGMAKIHGREIGIAPFGTALT